MRKMGIENLIVHGIFYIKCFPWLCPIEVGTVQNAIKRVLSNLT